MRREKEGMNGDREKASGRDRAAGSAERKKSVARIDIKAGP